MGQKISNDEAALATASTLMSDFAHQTGLVDASNPAVRYLWTDAFAVCNFLELFRRSDDAAYMRQALSLITQVHMVLGKHRSDDARSGWISALPDDVAIQHPTAGGLRIGKKRNERAENEPPNNTLEWDRDGQYFHYLSKWMHSLNQAACVSGDVSYLLQALELAKVAHSCFTYTAPDASVPRMYWKMSIDLSRPLITSMGHHDPLDALVTYRELQATSQRLAMDGAFPQLTNEVNDVRAMCAGQNWTTDDPLGIGGLLFDAYRVAQMSSADADPDGDFLESLLSCANDGLQVFFHTSVVSEPAQFRLAFRELGLSIGLRALTHTKLLLDTQWQRLRNGPQLVRLLDDMQRFLRLRSTIESFWLNNANRQSASWTDHRDINTVMLATSLLPDGFLRLDQRNEPIPIGTSQSPSH